MEKYADKWPIQRKALLFCLYLSGIAQQSKMSLSIESRINELVQKMTLEEKVGQINLATAGDITRGQVNSSDVAKNIQQGKVGSLFNIK